MYLPYVAVHDGSMIDFQAAREFCGRKRARLRLTKTKPLREYHSMVFRARASLGLRLTFRPFFDQSPG